MRSNRIRRNRIGSKIILNNRIQSCKTKCSRIRRIRVRIGAPKLLPIQ